MFYLRILVILFFFFFCFVNKSSKETFSFFFATSLFASLFFFLPERVCVFVGECKSPPQKKKMESITHSFKKFNTHLNIQMHTQLAQQIHFFSFENINTNININTNTSTNTNTNNIHLLDLSFKASCTKKNHSAFIFISFIIILLSTKWIFSSSAREEQAFVLTNTCFIKGSLYEDDPKIGTLLATSYEFNFKASRYLTFPVSFRVVKYKRSWP